MAVVLVILNSVDDSHKIKQVVKLIFWPFALFRGLAMFKSVYTHTCFIIDPGVSIIIWILIMCSDEHWFWTCQVELFKWNSTEKPYTSEVVVVIFYILCDANIVSCYWQERHFLKKNTINRLSNETIGSICIVL